MFRPLNTISAILVLIAAGAGSFAHAADFQQKHPRRAEVNQRERNERKRINDGVKDGTMTKAEAKDARQNLRNIKGEERAEVKANGGHLTKSEQADLNRQENANSKQIYQDKHPAAPAPAAPAPVVPTSN
jgi:hypothetical protein